jgi:light-regulated signal transduction histidine kinase (bacteriophytochrome)
MVEDLLENHVNDEGKFYLDLITHDIKNLNQGVHGYLELMAMLPETTDKQKKFLEEALSYVKMSSNLIHSIELDSRTNGKEHSIGLSQTLTDAKNYIESLNTIIELEIVMVGLTPDRTVRGNLLLVELFLFLMDFMVKRCIKNKLKIGIRVKENLDNSVTIKLEGDFKAPDQSSVSSLFSDNDPISGRKKGKLALCRSIVQRFGGTINYFGPTPSSTYKGGGFNVELKEVGQ